MTAHAVCEPAATNLQLQAALSDAEVAFSQMDLAGFEHASDAASEDLGCLGEPLTLPDAAAVHRVEALASFVDGDRSRTVLGLQAVRELQPGYRLPPSIAPENHPLRADWERAQELASGASRDLSRPAEGWLLIDGVRTTALPLDRPSIYQHLDDQGYVLSSRYLDPGDEVPAYEIWVAPPPVEVLVSGTTPLPPPVKPPVSRALLRAGLGAAVAASGMWFLSTRTAKRFWDPATDAGELEGLRLQTNALSVGSVGVGGVALGLTGVALVLRRW